jgi:hypothetical protein
LEEDGAGNEGEDDNGNDIDRLLDEADEQEIIMLDPTTLRQLLLNLEKKVSKNQKMRMKFPDEPAKFMESELELNLDLQVAEAVGQNLVIVSVL